MELSEVKRRGWLTHDTLNELIPVVRAGVAARDVLADPAALLTASERGDLLVRVAAAERAESALLDFCAPLIKEVAWREHRQRLALAHSTSIDDALQDAAMGVLRGLRRYELLPPGVGEGTVNVAYLRQWGDVYCRRGRPSEMRIPVNERDLAGQVSAARRRLREEFNREPSDWEIADACESPALTPEMVAHYVQMAAAELRVDHFEDFLPGTDDLTVADTVGGADETWALIEGGERQAFLRAVLQAAHGGGEEGGLSGEEIVEALFLCFEEGLRPGQASRRLGVARKTLEEALERVQAALVAPEPGSPVLQVIDRMGEQTVRGFGLGWLWDATHGG